MNSKQEQGKAGGEFYPRWRTALHFVAGLVFMVGFWPLGLLYLLICKLRSKLLRHSLEKQREIGQRSLSRAFRVCLRGLECLGIIRVDDRSLEKKVPLKGRLVIVSNHPALWDSLLIMRHCESISCIMKASLLSNPLLRGGALFAGFLPNSPRLKMVRSAVERLEGGGQLLLFPEGTRTRKENAPLNPFYPGMALIACQSQARVLPIFIETNSPYLGKGWPIWKMPDFPIRIRLKVGEILQPEVDEKARVFSDRLEEVFRKQFVRG